MKKRNGKVYLTGGGCGDTGLLTLKAAEVLRSCDVVVYDSLVAEELLRWTRPDCEKIYVGKRYGSHAGQQSEINGLLAEKALEGKLVVRLKGGDPYVFGRGGEEFLALKEAGISCEEIPGITSAIAVPAAAGIPVTHRGLSAAVTVVTGTAAAEEDGQGEEQEQGQRRGQGQKQTQGQRKAYLRLDFDALARLEGTLVILMGMHHLKEITEGLLAAGKSPDTPCAIVMEGTTSRQRCLRTALGRLYGEAKEQGFTSPAVIVVGAVANLQLTDQKAVRKTVAETVRQETDREAWTSGRGRPLMGVTVGVTGTPHFAGKLATALEQEGAEVKDMSFMEVRQTKERLPELRAFGWLVFTSPNGVRVFLDKMRQERQDLRSLSGKKIAVIGPGTAAALEENGIYADYMPQVYDAKHLAEGLAEKILAKHPEACMPEKRLEAGLAENPLVEQGRQERAVFLRARQGSDELPLIFSEKGISFEDYPLYELGVCAKRRSTAVAEEPDYIVFGSALGVRAYFEGLEGSGSFAEKICGHISKSASGRCLRRGDVEEDARYKYVCIGERCSEELKKYTADSFLVATEPGIEAIVECIRRDVT